MRNAEAIEPGVEHINRTGGVVAGALPLLYGMAEGIVAGVTPKPEQPATRPPAGRPPGAAARGCTTAVGYAPSATRSGALTRLAGPRSDRRGRGRW